MSWADDDDDPWTGDDLSPRAFVAILSGTVGVALFVGAMILMIESQ